jgi:hypothetical protein
MRVIVEQLVDWRLAGETEVLGENLPQHHFVYHKIPHDQTRAAAVGSQRLTAWAMVRPLCYMYICVLWWTSLKLDWTQNRKI